MELQEILKILKEPEKLISAEEANLLASYLSGFINDAEEELNELNYKVSVKHYGLLEKLKRISWADRALELEPIYLEREKVKLKLSQLRRLRADVRGRYEVLSSIKRNY